MEKAIVLPFTYIIVIDSVNSVYNDVEAAKTGNLCQTLGTQTCTASGRRVKKHCYLYKMLTCLLKCSHCI